MLMKRFIIGTFLDDGSHASPIARATSFASAMLQGTKVEKAVYNETIAKGPRSDGFGFDFIIEAWTEDADPGFDVQRAIRTARDAGIDPERSRTVLANEKIIKPGSAAVKGTFLSKRRPDSSVEEYLKYWRGQHADIIQAQKDFFSFVRGYVQNHFVAGSYMSISGTRSSQEDAFDGSPQMWFDSPDDIYGAFATNGYQKFIKDDEKILVKVGYSQSFVAREYPIIL